MAQLIGTTGEKEGTRTGSREISREALTATRKSWMKTVYVVADFGETEDDVMVASGVPLLGTVNSNAFLKKKHPREIKQVIFQGSEMVLWELDLHYDSHIDVSDFEDILQGSKRNLDWSWSRETIDEVVQRDPITGEPIINSVGEPLLITAPTPIPVLTVSKVEDTFDPRQILKYSGRTNSQPFIGAPRGVVLNDGIEDEPLEEHGIMRRKITYVFKFNLKIDPDDGEMKGWRAILLNHGTYYYEEAALEVGEKVPVIFRDINKNPITGNLREDGTALPPGEPHVYKEFNRLAEADFNELNVNPYAT